MLTAERKNGAALQIEGIFNVGITYNSRLKVKLDGDTAAYRRRLLIVNYERPRPEKPDPQFLENLITSEASGILRWMVDGARLLLADIADSGDIVLTEPQVDRVKSLLAESDSVRQFVRKGLTRDGRHRRDRAGAGGGLHAILRAPGLDTAGIPQSSAAAARRPPGNPPSQSAQRHKRHQLQSAIGKAEGKAQGSQGRGRWRLSVLKRPPDREP